MRFALERKISIVEFMFQFHSSTVTRRKFIGRYSKMSSYPQLSTSSNKVLQKFKETGSVLWKPAPGRKSLMAYRVLIVKEIFERPPDKSTCRVAKETNLPFFAVRRILRGVLKFKPYKKCFRSHGKVKTNEE